MVIDLGAYMALLDVVPLGAARAMAILAAMTWNFALNRSITFDDVSTPQRAGVVWQYLLFCSACTLGASVNWGVSVGLSTWMAFFDQWKVLAAFTGIIAGMGFNYTLCRLVVFRRQAAQPRCRPEALVDPAGEPVATRS